MANQTDEIARERARRADLEANAAAAAVSAEQQQLRSRQRAQIADLVPQVLAALADRGHPGLENLDVWRTTLLGRRHEERGGYAVCKFRNERGGAATTGRLYLLSDGDWLFGTANDRRPLADHRLDRMLGEVLDGLQDLLQRHPSRS